MDCTPAAYQYTSLQADQQFVAPTRANLRCPFLLLLFAFFLFFYPFKLLMSGHCYKMIQALNAKTFSNCSIMGYHNRCAKATELTCTDNLNFNIFLLIRTQVGKLQVLLTSFSYLCNYILYASLRFWDLIKTTIKEYICIYSWQFWFQPVMFKYHLKFVYKDFFFSVLRNISF